MTSTSKVIVGFATAGTAVSIVVSLFVIGSLVRDINSLYDEITGEMVEFRDVANDAWNGMMNINQKVAGVNAFGRSQPESIFTRFKRQYDAGVSGGSAAAGGGSCSEFILKLMESIGDSSTISKF